MHLKRYTDYSLRVLLYLGLHQDRLVTISEIATTFNISKNHLMKVVKDLVAAGFIQSVKGKLGGLRLAHQPEMINIGAVVRRMESDFALVECLGNDNTCRILPACSLKPILQDAGERFLDALDAYSLADVLDNRKVLVKLLTDDRRLKIHPVPSDPTSRLN